MVSSGIHILVTGSEGQLGKAIAALAPRYSQYNFSFANRSQLDITQPQQVAAVIADRQPDVIINTAAYTAVDAAEENKEQAFEVNELGPKILADICKEHEIALIHISTDYVFDGEAQQPYKENDPINPQTVYGQSKRAGEEAILKAKLTQFLIIRTSWLYGPYGHNFLKTMLRLGQERTQLKVVNDQHGIPTSVMDLATAILTMLPQLEATHSGVYHYSNSGLATWYNFAQFIFDFCGLEIHLDAVSTTQFPTPAQRPKYSVLNCDKIRETFEVNTPHWKESAASILSIVNK